MAKHAKPQRRMKRIHNFSSPNEIQTSYIQHLKSLGLLESSI